MYIKSIMSKIPEHLLLYYNVSKENNVQNSRTFTIILQCISRKIPEHLLLYYNVPQENNV